MNGLFSFPLPSAGTAPPAPLPTRAFGYKSSCCDPHELPVALSSRLAPLPRASQHWASPPLRRICAHPQAEGRTSTPSRAYMRWEGP